MYKICFESCQLSKLNSFTHQESDFRKLCYSQSSARPKKKRLRNQRKALIKESCLQPGELRYKPLSSPRPSGTGCKRGGRSTVLCSFTAIQVAGSQSGLALSILPCFFLGELSQICLCVPTLQSGERFLFFWRVPVEGVSRREAEESRFR